MQIHIHTKDAHLSSASQSQQLQLPETPTHRIFIKTCEVVLVHTLAGKVPVNSVPPASKHSRRTRFPRLEGKVPRKEFLSSPFSAKPRSRNNSRFVNAVISIGIDPESKFKPRSNSFMRVSRPTSVGICPDKLFSPMLRITLRRDLSGWSQGDARQEYAGRHLPSCDNFPISRGMDPEKPRFEEKLSGDTSTSPFSTSVVKLASKPISVGMDPVPITPFKLSSTRGKGTVSMTIT